MHAMTMTLDERYNINIVKLYIYFTYTSPTIHPANFPTNRNNFERRDCVERFYHIMVRILLYTLLSIYTHEEIVFYCACLFVELLNGVLYKILQELLVYDSEIVIFISYIHIFIDLNI